MPPYPGYMGGYSILLDNLDGQYMMPPPMSGYGGDYGMQGGNPNFSGSGSGYPPSSSGQYGYYGYLPPPPPHGYSSYGSV